MYMQAKTTDKLLSLRKKNTILVSCLSNENKVPEVLLRVYFISKCVNCLIIV